LLIADRPLLFAARAAAADPASRYDQATQRRVQSGRPHRCRPSPSDRRNSCGRLPRPRARSPPYVSRLAALRRSRARVAPFPHNRRRVVRVVCSRQCECWRCPPSETTFTSTSCTGPRRTCWRWDWARACTSGTRAQAR
jgi:hypothetical protein